MTMHSKEQLFECSECLKRFADANALENHCELRHQAQPQLGQDFEKSCLSPVSERQHSEHEQDDVDSELSHNNDGQTST